jgi:hypothetical protein
MARLGLVSGGAKTSVKQPKKTSIGRSKNTHFVSKNDKRIKKAYRGQG